MRRFLSLVGLTITLAIIGCGGSTNTGTTTPASAVPKPTVAEEEHERAVEQKQTKAEERIEKHKEEQEAHEQAELTYPSKFGESFLARCEHAPGRGGANMVCLCILRNSEGKIPLKQFVHEGDTLARTTETEEAPKLLSVIQECARNESVRTEQENENPEVEKERAKAFAKEMFP